MRILRIVLGAFVFVYALVGAAGAWSIAAYHLGLWRPPASVSPATLDLLRATSWAQLALWAVAIALYLVSAFKLFRRVKCFVFWSTAFLLDVVNWMWLRAEGYYDAAIPGPLAYADYAVLASNLAVGAAILMLGRTYLD